MFMHAPALGPACIGCPFTSSPWACLFVFVTSICLFLSLLAPNVQIYTLVVLEDHVYLGTTLGCMVVCESMSLRPLSKIQCYMDPLDYLIPLKMTQNRARTGQHKEQLILTCGRGCLDKWNKNKKKPAQANHSTILTWYADGWHT